MSLEEGCVRLVFSSDRILSSFGKSRANLILLLKDKKLIQIEPYENMSKQIHNLSSDFELIFVCHIPFRTYSLPLRTF